MNIKCPNQGWFMEGEGGQNNYKRLIFFILKKKFEGFFLKVVLSQIFIYQFKKKMDDN